MKKQLFIFINIIFLTIGVYAKNNHSGSSFCVSNVQANFSWALDTNTIMKVDFTDQSVGAVISWDWDFGDNSYATGQYSTHTYASPGFYHVCLTVEDTSGCIDEYCDSVFVSYTMQCSSNFSFQKQGLTVLFNGDGNPTPIEYIWDFGDATSNSTQSILHTYQTSGTYNACLTTKSIDLITLDTCTNQYCKSITVLPAATLLGQVFVDTNDGNFADKAEAYLIHVDSANVFTIIDTTLLIDTGSYTYFLFQDIPYGRYTIKTQLSSSSNYYLDYLPTYYGNKAHWSHAQIINIESVNNNSAFIDLIKISKINGIGSISGNILEGSSKNPGDPVPNVQAILFDISYDPVALTYSNENGKYSFGNLQFNDYIVYAEVIGKSTFPPTVSLNSSNPIVQNVNLYINSTSVTQGVESIENNLSENNIGQIFPNPSSDAISFDIKSVTKREINIMIYNSIGQNVYSTTKNISSIKANVSINVSYFNQGVYFVNIQQGDNTFVVRKFIKL